MAKARPAHRRKTKDMMRTTSDIPKRTHMMGNSAEAVAGSGVNPDEDSNEAVEL